MKREINLRTREFVVAREFYLPRVIITLVLLGALALLIVASIFIIMHIQNQESQITFLGARKQELTVKVDPVRELKDEIAVLEVRANLKISLSENLYLWADHYRQFHRLASQRDIFLTYRNANQAGELIIRGRSGRMAPVASYLQDLDGIEEISKIFYTYIIYDDNKDLFEFQFEAQVEAPGGAQQDG